MIKAHFMDVKIGFIGVMFYVVKCLFRLNFRTHAVGRAAQFRHF